MARYLRIALIAFVIGAVLLPAIPLFHFSIPVGADDGGQVSVRVAASADDSSMNDSTYAYDNTYIHQLMGRNDAGNASNAAMRFTGITIPADSIITSAYIQFTASATKTDTPVSLTIKGEDSGTPAAYGAAENFTSRTYTTTGVAWTVTGTWTLDSTYNSADITTVVQELYDSYGPYSADDMAFEILGSSGAASWLVKAAYSYDNSAAKAPLLVINYSPENVYWVGGTGDYSDATNHWASSSGGTPNAYNAPNAYTNVHFDASSDSGAQYTVTLNSASQSCKDMDWTGAEFNPIFSINAGSNTTLYIYGSLTLISGMTVTGNDSWNTNWNFCATATGKTITSADRIANSGNQNMTFNGAGGGWTLQDNLDNTGGTARMAISLTQGALDTNGKTIVAGYIYSQGSSIRSLTLGASSINCNYTNSTDAWLLSGTNLTFNANTSTIVIESGHFAGGGYTYNNVTFSTSSSQIEDNNTIGTLLISGNSNTVIGNNNITTLTVSGTSPTLSGTNTVGTATFTGGGTYTFSAANSFTNLSISGANSATDNVSLGGNQTVSGTLTLVGYSQGKRLLIKSNTLHTARTITSATNTFSNVDFRDITAAGAGSWNLAAISGYSGNCGGNTGITFTTATTVYAVGGAGNYSWSDSTKWASTSAELGGVPGSGRVPLPQDLAVFTAGSVTMPGINITLDSLSLGGLNATALTTDPTFTATNAYFYNSVNISNACTWTVTNTYMYGQGAQTMSGDFGATNIYQDVQNVGGSISLPAALTTTGTFYHQSGSTNLAGFAFTVGIFDSFTTTTYSRSLAMGASTVTLTSTATATKWNVSSTNFSLYAQTSTIVFSNSTNTNTATFKGGGLTYYKFTIQGSQAFTTAFADANTFTTMTIDRSSAAKTISGNFTQTMASLVAATSGTRTVTITNTDFTKSNTNKASYGYFVISGSTASPATTWYAASTSTDNGGNSGWVWADLNAPTGSTEAATLVTKNAATLNANISSLGGYSYVDVGFEYGLTASYGTESNYEMNITGTGDVTGRRITGLSSGKTYHYRVIINYASGTVLGGDETFTTLSGSGTGGGSDYTIPFTTPPPIDNMYDEGSNNGNILAPLFEDALIAADIDDALFWYMIAFALAIFLGFVAFHFTRNLIIQSIVSGVVMACFCGGGVLGDGLLPYWTVIIFIIEVVMVVLIQEKQNV